MDLNSYQNCVSSVGKDQDVDDNITIVDLDVIAIAYIKYLSNIEMCFSFMEAMPQGRMIFLIIKALLPSTASMM